MVTESHVKKVEDFGSAFVRHLLQTMGFIFAQRTCKHPHCRMYLMNLCNTIQQSGNLAFTSKLP